MNVYRMTRPKSVHVYREYSEKARYSAFESPLMVAHELTRHLEYLGEYFLRGEVLMSWWEIRIGREVIEEEFLTLTNARKKRDRFNRRHGTSRAYIVKVTRRKAAR